MAESLTALEKFQKLTTDERFLALSEEEKKPLLSVATDAIKAERAQASVMGPPAPPEEPSFLGRLAGADNPAIPKLYDQDIRKQMHENWPAVVGSLAAQAIASRLGAGPAVQGLAAGLTGAAAEGASQYLGNSPKSLMSILMQGAQAIPGLAYSGKQELATARAARNPSTPVAIAEDALKQASTLATPLKPPVSSNSLKAALEANPEWNKTIPTTTQQQVTVPPSTSPLLSAQGQPITTPGSTTMQTVPGAPTYPIPMTNAMRVAKEAQNLIKSTGPMTGVTGANLANELSVVTDMVPAMNAEGVFQKAKLLNDWRGEGGGGLSGDAQHFISKMVDAIRQDAAPTPLGPQLDAWLQAYKRETAAGNIEDMVRQQTRPAGGVPGIQNTDTLAKALEQMRYDKQVMHDPSTPMDKGGPGVVNNAEWQAIMNQLLKAQQEQRIYGRGGGQGVAGSMIAPAAGAQIGAAVGGVPGAYVGADLANKATGVYRRGQMKSGLTTPAYRQSLLDAIREPIKGNWGTAAGPSLMQALIQAVNYEANKEGDQGGETGPNIVGKLSSGRPIVRNADGSVSTHRNMTVELDGKTYIVPTMYSGKEVSPDQAVDIIRRNKMIDPDTGQRLQPYKTQQEAAAAEEQLHKLLEQETAPYMSMPSQ